MKAHITLAALALIVLSAGCASVPTTSVSLDSEAKQFNPAPGKAGIYLNRPSGIGTAVTMQTIFDGRIAGALAPNTFQLFSVPPGEHTVAVGAGENVEQVIVNAESGRNYFYNATFSMGWAAPRAHVKELSEEEGRKGVLKSKRAEATTY